MYKPPIKGKLKKKKLEPVDESLKEVDAMVTFIGDLNDSQTKKFEELKEDIVITVEEKLSEVDVVIEELQSIEPIPGKDGKDAEPVDEEKIIKSVLERMPVPENGKDAVIDEDKMIKDILEKIPPPKELDEKKIIKKILSSLPEKKGDLKIIQEKIETDPMSVIEKIMEMPDFKIKSTQIEGLEQTISAFHNQLGRGYLHGGGISNITGLVQAGTDITVTGSGTSTDPYVINFSGAAGVTSVDSSDSSLTVFPTTGAVDAIINTSHQNFWLIDQDFHQNINFFPDDAKSYMFKMLADSSGTQTSQLVFFDTTGKYSGFQSQVSGNDNIIWQLPNLDQEGFLYSNGSLITSFAGISTDGVTIVGNGTPSSPITAVFTGTVTSVSGTADRITSTGGTAPVIDIAATYVGQASITTLGTITTGVWNGTDIVFANLQQIATDRLVGRDTAGTGDMEQLTVSGGIEFTGGGGIQTSAFTGDATKTAGGTVLTLATVNSNVGSFTYASITVNAKGLITAASNGTTPEVPLTFSTGLTRTVNTITANLSTGVAGGQSAVGGINSGDNLTLSSTTNGTKGKIILGTASAYDQVNDRLGIATTSPSYKFHISGNVSNLPSAGIGNFLIQSLSVDNMTFGANNYFDGSNQVYAATTAQGVSNIQMFNGDIYFHTAVSGTAGATASMIRALTIKKSALANSVFISANTAVGVGIGLSTVTASLHIKAGTTSASTAPLKFTTGTSMTNAEAGAMEYTTDDLFFTISTGTARKRLLMADPVGGLTSGRIPVATTNGRLTDDANFTYAAASGMTLIQATLGNVVQTLSSVATNDDPTELLYQNRVATTDATVTTLHTFTVPTSAMYAVDVTVVAVRTGGAAGAAGDGGRIRLQGVYYNNAGTVAIKGSLTSTPSDFVGGMTATLDTTGATIRVRVTGVVNVNITWHMSVGRVYSVAT